MERRFTHQPSGFNTDDRYDRTVKCDGETICRLTQYPPDTGPWRFSMDELGYISALTLDAALALIKETVEARSP